MIGDIDGRRWLLGDEFVDSIAPAVNSVRGRIDDEFMAPLELIVRLHLAQPGGNSFSIGRSAVDPRYDAAQRMIRGNSIPLDRSASKQV